MTSSDLFESVYRGESLYGERPPWEIGGPQPTIVELEEAGLVTGAVLDPGCGTGETALHLADKGYDVTAVDFSATAISIARRKADERGLDITFEVGDVLNLDGWSERFDTIVDSGTARMFDADALATYAEVLHRICRPGAVAHVLAISDRGMAELQARLAEEVEGIPKGVPKDDEGAKDLQLTVDLVRDGLTKHWVFESVTDSREHYILPSSGETLELSAWLYQYRRS